MDKIIGLTLLLFFGISLQLQAQEICDNAIDDDGDGLIDLNDDDCICNSLIPSSLIPNPSFEEKTCCPEENERLDCAVSWIQASNPTTDYVHTCGDYLGNTSIPAFAPLPFPDGDGAVGFRDGQINAGENYKEYVGACLTESMEVGASYRFDFFVGFRDNITGSKDFKIALFAATQCSYLPFGDDIYNIGCPINAGNYVQLGEMNVSGSNEWVNVVFEFVADQAYEVIILGPSCSPNPNYQLDPYFYLDRLALAESSEFGIPFDSVTGSICENNLVLQVEEENENTYQWYLDGIALIGETNPSLSLTAAENTEGMYLVIISEPEGCQLSREYQLRFPPYYYSDYIEICEDEEYLFGADILTESGYYERLLPATDGCDSIIQLTFTVKNKSNFEITDNFCQGDVYSFLDINTTEEGIYQTTLLNAAGCDSVITIDLSLINPDAGIELDEVLTIDLGERIDLAPTYYDASYVSFVWTDESGNIISEELIASMYLAIHSTIVYLEAFDQYGCSVVDSMAIEVTPNHTMYIPNAFSPDDNGLNDHFRVYSSASVEKLQSVSIFDRWGGLVFQDFDISDVNTYFGWDGTVNGKKAGIGVYCYVINVLFIDGAEKIMAGDVTLVR